VREWLCSYWERIWSKDSSGSLVGGDSGVFGSDMGATVSLQNNIVVPAPPGSAHK